MTKGAGKINRLSDEIQIQSRNCPSWLSNFAAEVLKQQEKHAVEVVRHEDSPNPTSVYQQMNSLMNGGNPNKPYRTVQEAVKFYQERTGLADMQKKLLASKASEIVDEINKFAADEEDSEDKKKDQITIDQDRYGRSEEEILAEYGTLENYIEHTKVDLAIGRLVKLVDEYNDKDNIIKLEVIFKDPNQTLSKKHVISIADAADPGSYVFHEKYENNTDSMIEALDLLAQDMKSAIANLDERNNRINLNEIADNVELPARSNSPGFDLSDVTAQYNILLNKIANKPEFLEKNPAIDSFITNIIETQHGMQLPAIIQAILETFGRNVTERDLDDNDLIRFISNMIGEKEVKHDVNNLNIGRGVGTERTYYNSRDPNTQPFIGLMPARIY